MFDGAEDEIPVDSSIEVERFYFDSSGAEEDGVLHASLRYHELTNAVANAARLACI